MILRIIKIIIGLLVLALLLCGIGYANAPWVESPVWGVSFSPQQAAYLGLPWQETYASILDDLQPKKIRLMAYWETIEPQPGQYVFNEIDYMLVEAAKRNIEVTLTVGWKQPRWPECHQPNWASHLPALNREQALLSMLSSSVQHFASFDIITTWQLENEPFFRYGPDCDTVSKELYRKELDIIRAVDIGRPVMITDSGEKSIWLNSSYAGADILGATMYRTVYHDKKQKYITYPLPAWTYAMKAGLVQLLSPVDTVVGSELQAEPWLSDLIHDVPITDQKALMNEQVFLENVAYAKRSGLPEHYFWGAEWWYWLKVRHNDATMWEAAKKVIQE